MLKIKTAYTIHTHKLTLEDFGFFVIAFNRSNFNSDNELGLYYFICMINETATQYASIINKLSLFLHK